MGLFAMFQAVAAGEIRYKIWAVYIVYNPLQVVVSYYLIPETGKLNLEEIDSIFETPVTRPVKLSVKIADAKREKERVERETVADLGL